MRTDRPRMFIVIWTALFVHLIQTISLIYFPTQTVPIDIAAILEFIPLSYAPAAILTASGLAFISLIDVPMSWFARLLLLLPQQGLITLAVVGAIQSVLKGAYADGTVKSSIHIFNDQLWLIAYFVIHGYSVMRRVSAT